MCWIKETKVADSCSESTVGRDTIVAKSAVRGSKEVNKEGLEGEELGSFS
jgi:hypothetical protein